MISLILNHLITFYNRISLNSYRSLKCLYSWFIYVEICIKRNDVFFLSWSNQMKIVFSSDKLDKINLRWKKLWFRIVALTLSLLRDWKSEINSNFQILRIVKSFWLKWSLRNDNRYFSVIWSTYLQTIHCLKNTIIDLEWSIVKISDDTSSSWLFFSKNML